MPAAEDMQEMHHTEVLEPGFHLLKVDPDTVAVSGAGWGGGLGGVRLD